MMMYESSSSSSEAVWEAAFEQCLRAFLPFLSPGEPLHADAKLRDYGLDSISVISLLAELEDRFQIHFSADALDLANFETPGRLWSTLQSLR